MSVITKAAAVASAAVATTLFFAIPATAEPGDNTCGGGVGSLLCRLVPIAPGLDHDIDLTTDLGTDNGTVDRPTTDLCSVNVGDCY